MKIFVEEPEHGPLDGMVAHLNLFIIEMLFIRSNHFLKKTKNAWEVTKLTLLMMSSKFDQLLMIV